MKTTKTNLIKIKSKHLLLKELNKYDIEIYDGYGSIHLTQSWLDELIELLQTYKNEKQKGGKNDTLLPLKREVSKKI